MDKKSTFEVKIAKQALLEWYRSKSPVDRVLYMTLREHQVGSQQRARIAHAVYMMVRGWSVLLSPDFEPENPQQLRKFEEVVLKSFDLNYEMLELLHQRAKPLVEKNPIEHILRNHGVPHQFFSEFQSKPLEFHQFLHEGSFAEAPLNLRCNTLVNSPTELIEKLRQELPAQVLVEQSPFVEESIRVSEHYPLHLSSLHKEGCFEIQDEHSQLVSKMVFYALLEKTSGASLKILDLCAGAGGKTLHLAALFQNKCEIFAYDLIKAKRAELRVRAKRAGAECIKIVEDLSKLKDKFDFVLIDAPCSSLGTLRRNPDRVFRFQVDEAKRLVAIQSDILLKGLNLKKAGGQLLYATCTIRDRENFSLVEPIVREQKHRIVSAWPYLEKSIRVQSLDVFLTNLRETSSFKLLDSVAASMCPQFGPSTRQVSGRLIGDSFFTVLIE